MQIHDHLVAAQVGSTPTRRRRRVLVGGALAMVLASISIVAALADRSSPAVQPNGPAAVSGPTEAPAAVQPQQNAAPTSTSSTPAWAVLSDGTYPAYITRVDVKGATITIDVIQVFENGEAAINAAVEDGMSRDEAQYLYVYIRNQNPRLRTLPVAGEVRIHFADGCEASPARDKALSELARRTAASDKLYFYEVRVARGVIHEITQRLAAPAC